jgi:hypothetical protein|nr:MAG TPA: hypothetical protein [Caudoviricetes sp.]
MKNTVYAREYKTGIAGVEGILTYAAAGYEDQMTAADLLKAVEDKSISEDDYLNDETGKIHAISIEDCEEYLKSF